MILWKVVFNELRELTSTTKISDAGLNVNPFEINGLMDHLWNVAVLLQSDAALSILGDDYWPWPKVWAGEAASQRFFQNLEKNREANRQTSNYSRPGWASRSCVFGIHNGQVPTSTNSIFRNETRSDWELGAVANLLSTDNAAERPFGIVKAYCKIYPSMSLRTLAGYSLGMANGSHRAPTTREKQQRTAHVQVFEGGADFTSAPEVRIAVKNVCGVRRVETGKVTSLLDKIYDTNRDEATQRRETERLEVIEAQ